MVARGGADGFPMPAFFSIPPKVLPGAGDQYHRPGKFQRWTEQAAKRGEG